MSRRRSRPDLPSNANNGPTASEPGFIQQNAARDLILVSAAKQVTITSPNRKLAPRLPNQIRYRTAFQTTIGDVLRNRGWKETDQDLDWDIIWADASWIRDVYDHVHLEPHQRVNHFRNHYELTRKDLLVKNLKRAKRLLINNGLHDEALKYDFFPKTFNLPGEYSLFVEEFKKNPSSSWIMKPIARSQGKGIFLFQKLSDISDWRHGADRSATASNNNGDGSGTPPAELYVVQQYISNPYLVGGKKFDMRVYVLVTSYSPLTVYLYRTGFARFSSSRFSMSNSHLQDNHIHLTNVAIQKSAPKYDPKNGGKWSLRNLKLYLMGIWGQSRVNQLFTEMELVIIRSLLAVRKVMINDKHSFELYGYDLLFDQGLKVWLLEVNAYPSLSANTKDDYRMKFDLLDDMLTVIDLEKKLTGTELQIGGFDLIYRHGLIEPEPNHIVRTYLGCSNNRIVNLAQLERQRNGQQRPADGSSKSK